MVGEEALSSDPLAPEDAARRYAEELVATLGAEPLFDLSLLGIGEDGHVASLFPGHPSVDERAGFVLVEGASPKPPATRLTLSLPLLTASRMLVIAAFGEAKAA